MRPITAHARKGVYVTRVRLGERERADKRGGPGVLNMNRSVTHILLQVFALTLFCDGLTDGDSDGDGTCTAH